MAFTPGNVTVPASGNTPVLVYTATVATNITVNSAAGTCYLLNSATQTPTSGFWLSSDSITIPSFIGSIYGVSANSAFSLYYSASSLV